VETERQTLWDSLVKEVEDLCDSYSALPSETSEEAKEAVKEKVYAKLQQIRRELPHRWRASKGGAGLARWTKYTELLKFPWLGAGDVSSFWAIANLETHRS
jgi:hypothetical protein